MNPTLHTLNTPPSDRHTLSLCLDAMSTDDVLLLIEDAVYLAAPPHRHSLSPHLNIYALAIDLNARGVKADSSVSVIDDVEFVALSLACNRVVSWF